MSGKRTKAERRVEWATLPPEVQAARIPGTDQVADTRAVYLALVAQRLDQEIAAGRGDWATVAFAHMLRNNPVIGDRMYAAYCATYHHAAPEADTGDTRP